MNWSEKERILLAAIQFRADATVPELSRVTGLREHVIHYQLARFRAAGLIRRWAFLDMFALGYEEYEILFSLAAPSKRLKTELLTALRQHPQVVWLAELGGDYQYGITIYAAGAQAAADFMKKIAQQFGNIFCRKSMAAIISFTILAKKYLSRLAVDPEHALVSLRDTGSRFELDDTDRRILPALFRPELDSDRALAQATGLPRATLEYRLKKLERAKVIQSYIYHISAAKLGLQLFKLLVFVRGVQPDLEAALFGFCRRHKHVTNFTHCLGSWDYEIGMDVPEAPQATAVVEQLYEKFGQAINDIQVLPVFSQTNSSNFMC